MSDIVDPDWPTHRDRHFADAIAMQREIGVRAGELEPLTDEESRQAKEGPVWPRTELDAFKFPAWRKPK